MRIQSFSKALTGRDRYSVNWEEDLLGIIEVFEMTSGIHGLTDDEKHEAIPFMLEGAALSYYASNIKTVSTSYTDALGRLKAWYTSDDQQSKSLSEWHSVNFTEWCKAHPKKSQAEVFRNMCARLHALQRQLHEDYHNLRFLKDRIVSAANTKQLKRS